MPALLIGLLPLAILLLASIGAALTSDLIVLLSGEWMPQAKLIGKLTLILLLLSVLPLRRWLRLSWPDLGFCEKNQILRQLGKGLLLSSATLIPILLGCFLAGIRVWDDSQIWTFGKLGGKVAMSLLLALLIGIGEELLFRGLLLAGLRRKLPLFASMAISSLYFAALHFLKAPSSANSGSLSLLWDAYANWFSLDKLPPMASLLVIGLFLARLRLQSPHALLLCIGCHAGWVWQIKLFKDLFNLNPHSKYLFLVTGYDGVVGPLIGCWLLATLVAWHFIAPISPISLPQTIAHGQRT